MRYLILFLGILMPFLGTAHAQSQLLYANQNWSVVHTERKGHTARCYITSKGSPIGEGYVYLVLFPNSILLVTGENIGDHLQYSVITMRVGGSSVEVPANSIMSGIMIVADLLSGKHKDIVVTVEGKGKTVHIFHATGFQHAHTRMTECLNEVGKSNVQVITIGE